MAKKPVNNRLVLLFLLIAVALIGGVVSLKIMTGRSDSEKQGDSSDAVDSNGRVAVPDTSVAPGTLPVVPDTVTAPSDSVGRDPRPADEAGAEDGYWNGYYDGVAGKEMTENDVESNFPTPEQRKTYAENYAEGYARGYAEGSKGNKPE